MSEYTLNQMHSDKCELERNIHNLIDEFRDKYPIVDMVHVEITRESIKVSSIGEEDYYFRVNLNVSI